MPNWCSNTLVIWGPAEDVKRFIAAASGKKATYNDFYDNGNDWGGFDDIRLKVMLQSPPDDSERYMEDFSFHSLFPVPDEVRCFPYDPGSAKRVAEKAGISPPEKSGYDWETFNWGVKWGGSDTCIINQDDTSVTYSFNTPWSPAIEFHTKVARDWPTLHFNLHYEESGMGFMGDAEWESGMIMYDHCHDMENELEDDEEMEVENV